LLYLIGWYCEQEWGVSAALRAVAVRSGGYWGKIAGKNLGLWLGSPPGCFEHDHAEIEKRKRGGKFYFVFKIKLEG